MPSLRLLIGIIPGICVTILGCATAVPAVFDQGDSGAELSTGGSGNSGGVPNSGGTAGIGGIGPGGTHGSGGMPSASCSNLACFDVFDCAFLYLGNTCGFTQCVAGICK